MVSNKELRFRARKTLGGNIFSSSWLYPLLVGIILSFVTSATSLVIVGILAIGLIAFGQAKYFLNISRKTTAPDNLSPLVEGVKQNAMTNVVLGLLVNLFVSLWSLLFIIPGIVKSYSYSMAYYIKCDHPEYSATQAIDESRKLMYGHKWRLFTLHLSFIGWYILCTFTFGIGFLWLSPYIVAAQTEFYLDLIGETPVSEEAPSEKIENLVDFKDEQ